MAKKKWYVVIVGTSVGVFSNWLEVSPLITGVSGARHQSFGTKEEAIEAFSVECAKGRVRVVDAASSSVTTSPSSSSRTTPRRTQSFVTRSPQSPASVNTQHANGRRDSHFSPAATVRTPSGLSYYPSRHSRTTSSVSPRSPATGRLSPLALRSPTLEHVRADTDVNMSPSRRSQASTRSFRSPGGQLHVNISFPAPECAHCGGTAEGPSEETLSNAFSQMHVSHNTVYEEQIDPRSPMPGTRSMPLSTNMISFGRPSPSRTPRSDSVLFRQRH